MSDKIITLKQRDTGDRVLPKTVKEAIIDLELATVATSGDYDDLSNKPTALSSFTDDLGSSPTHTHSQYEDIAKAMSALSASGTLALSDNSTYKLSATGTVTFTLPTITDTTKFHQILVQLYMSSAQTIDLGTTYYFTGEAPNMSEAGYYTIIFEYDNISGGWVVGAMKKASV